MKKTMNNICLGSFDFGLCLIPFTCEAIKYDLGLHYDHDFKSYMSFQYFSVT